MRVLYARDDRKRGGELNERRKTGGKYAIFKY